MARSSGESVDAITPVRDWAEVMSTEACRTRLEPDTLVRQQEYGKQLLEALDRFGRNGGHWRPQ